MRIGIPRETREGETRVAATPETVKKYVAAKHQVLVERGAGLAAHYTDSAYQDVGAQIVDSKEAFGADLLLKVRSPDASEIAQIKSGTVLAGMLDPFDAAGLEAMAAAGITGFALEAAPRITRAQSPAAKEQIESLGGKFIDVPFETDEEREIAKGVGGYARPMPAAWMARQATLVAERCKQADIVISTALIPGRPAPTLISEETVRGMKPGSVIVDLAVERGGNCPLSQKGLVVQENGVTLVGLTNLPGMVATDASALYARNLLDFLKLIIDKEGNLAIARDDEIVVACLMCEGGQVVRKK